MQEGLKTDFQSQLRRQSAARGSGQQQLGGAGGKFLSLGLRVINFAMRLTCDRCYGYNDDKFRSQGTTATHVIFSRISSFDLFVQTVAHIALSPNESSQIRQGEETERDVYDASMEIITLVLDIKPDLTPTLSQEQMVRLLLNLAMNCYNSNDLDKIAGKILFHLQ